MHNAPFLSCIALSMALAACGASTGSTPGGVKSFRMVRDDKALSFDGVTVTAREKDAQTIELVLVASSGCGGTGFDGCTEYTVTLALDRQAVPTGTAMAIAGTTSFAIDPSKGIWSFSLVPAPASSPAVENVGVMANCGPCDPPGTETQTLAGQLVIASIANATVAGTLHLDLTGRIPNAQEDRSTATIDAEFEVALSTR